MSAYEHLEARFGPWARVYASLCYLLTQLARMGTVMYLMALPMSVLLGWDIRAVILVTGVSVTIYALVGGLVAVIYTDAFQTIVLVAGAVVCAALMVGSLPGGAGAAASRSRGDHGKFSLGSLGPGLGEPTLWVVLLYGLTINLQNFGIDQNYVQRYIASKSDAEARKSVWLGGLTYVPLSAVFLFIGTALFAYFDAHPDALLPAMYRGRGAGRLGLSVVHRVGAALRRHRPAHRRDLRRRDEHRLDESQLVGHDHPGRLLPALRQPAARAERQSMRVLRRHDRRVGRGGHGGRRWR